MPDFIKFFSLSTANRRKSPATISFIVVGLVVIVIVILVYPPATWAVLAIMGATPAFLNALAAFVVTLRSRPVASCESKQQAAFPLPSPAAEAEVGRNQISKNQQAK